MNGPGDIPISNCTATERPCGFSLLPSLGMSCRGRAEAFARHLSSKLRTLGNSQNGDSPIDDEDPILNGGGPNTWITHVDQSNQVVTALQPLRNTSTITTTTAGIASIPISTNNQEVAADSFFDFDLEIESPGSPIDECEYSRLIETTSNGTPHDCATESGYICSPQLNSGSRASSQSSDGPYYDPISSDGEQLSVISDLTKQQHQQQQHTQTLQPNGHIPCSNINKLTTTPVEIIEKLITANMNENNNNNSNTIDKYNLLNGHCAYEIHDTDEVDFQQVHINKDTNNYHEDTQLHQNDEHSSSEQNEDSIKMKHESNSTNNHQNLKSSLKNQNNDNDDKNIDDENISAQNMVLDELHKISENIDTTITENVNIIMNGHCDDSENHDGHDIDVDVIDEKDEKVEIVEKIENQIVENVESDTQEILTNGHDEVIVEPEVPVPTATFGPKSDESQNYLIEEQTEQKTQQQQQQQQNENETENLNNIKNTTLSQTTEQEQNNQSNDTTTINKSTSLLKEDTDEEDDCKPQRVRRCSSLKTGKTPPGTPGRKKIVRFADVLGLDLADVKTFMDEIPNIPACAYQDLEIIEQEPPIQLGPRAEKILMPLFQSPGCIPSFLDMVRDKQVNLENALISDPINLTISGTVRVRNLDFHKSVFIRYTRDNWRTFVDVPAQYVQNSCDGFSDKFSFTVYANTMEVGQRLEFAVKFHVKGQQYWDNNYGANYCFQCLPSSNSINNRHIIPQTQHISGPLHVPTSDAWCVSFY